MRISRRLALALCLFSWLAADASADLDTNAIHDIYLNGDFDEATAILEKALKADGLARHGEKVFAYKHLGVMYAAREDTREKGKYYMLQLVQIEPTAKIMDMYASDMIYMIYRNIQEEYEQSRLRLERAKAHLEGNLGANGSAPDPAPEVARSASRRRSLFWMGGIGAAAVGIGITSYLLLRDPDPRKEVYAVE